MNLDNKNTNMEIIYDEIIVGSGFAGLYWCYKNKPKKFVVLEKSDRIGGRVYNIEWNGHQISLGGGIIKSSNKTTLKLINELGLEVGESISKYHFVDFETKTENLNVPNEDNFHESYKIITKYLKKKFEKNKELIKKNKLNWNEFLDLYLDLKTGCLIKSYLLYKTYSNSDIESVLNDEIGELLRTEDFKIFFIKQSGYTGLLNKLIDLINSTNSTNSTNSNILVNNEIIKVTKKNDIFNVETKYNQTYMTKKIILATESNTNIKFELGEDDTNNLSNLYKMVSGSKYIRVYSFHKEGHGLECSYYTNGLPGKVIYINPNILMCCYTEESQAIQLKNLLDKNSKSEQIEIVNELLKNCSIPIKTKPDDIIIKFWDTGVHYNTINYDKDKKTELLKKLKKSNIIVIGESIGDTHGWVNSALESVDLINNL